VGTCDIGAYEVGDIPLITWSNPGSIVPGTPLSATQLNATASVAGTFVYTPAIDTVLALGTHTLHVDFTPTDAVHFTNASKDVSITVTAGGGGGGGEIVPSWVIIASDGLYPERVRVDWTPTAGATYYLAYRSESLDGPKIPSEGYRATSPGGDDLWTVPGVTYYYWVKACTESSCGEFYTYNYDTGWQGLAAPLITASDGLFRDRVQVSWPAVLGASSYLGYRAESLAGTQIPVNGYLTTFPGGDDLWALPGVTYFYWVKACNGLNCSPLSAVETGWR
jgi:hypothetical protein